jgi:hypothetical protein
MPIVISLRSIGLTMKMLSFKIRLTLLTEESRKVSFILFEEESVIEFSKKNREIELFEKSIFVKLYFMTLFGSSHGYKSQTSNNATDSISKNKIINKSTYKAID